MRVFHNASFDPQTLVVLETAFDEAWLTLKAVGNSTVRPDELARSVLRLAMVRLHDAQRLTAGGVVARSGWGFRLTLAGLSLPLRSAESAWRRQRARRRRAFR